MFQSHFRRGTPSGNRNQSSQDIEQGIKKKKKKRMILIGYAWALLLGLLHIPVWKFVLSLFTVSPFHSHLFLCPFCSEIGVLTHLKHRERSFWDQLTMKKLTQEIFFFYKRNEDDWGLTHRHSVIIIISILLYGSGIHSHVFCSVCLLYGLCQLTWSCGLYYLRM